MLLRVVGDEDGLAPQVRVRVLALPPEKGDFLRLLVNGFREGASQIHGGRYYQGPLRTGKAALQAMHDLAMAP